MTKRRVLIVDDDPAARRLYGAFVRVAGFDVDEAASGVDAVRLVETHAYALVVMDLDMPGMDGWMATSLIRGRRPALPLIILTALQAADLQRRAHELGVASVLSKPCPHDALVQAIRRAAGENV